MNYEESVTNALTLLRRATETVLKERTILVDSVLHVRPRTDVANLLAKANPDGRKPADSTVRRMIIRTTQKMGLEELCEKEGRRSFETCDKYRREQCSKWIAENGGMPRLEQLADPFWDLRPQRPPSSIHAPPIPDASDSAAAKAPSANSESAESPAQAVSTTPTPVDSAPEASADKPGSRGKRGSTGKSQPAERQKGGKARKTLSPEIQQTQEDPSADNGKPESGRARLQRLLKENTSSLKKNKDGEIVSTRLPPDLREAMSKSTD